MSWPRAEAGAWAKAFEARHGRPLRVLHVGNIANNAFLNAKFLRAAGVDAHVLCHDYYHMMATPEWEEAVVDGDWGDDFRPNWGAVDLHGYRRPYWFVQGPFEACRHQLHAIQRLGPAASPLAPLTRAAALLQAAPGAARRLRARLAGALPSAGGWVDPIRTAARPVRDLAHHVVNGILGRNPTPREAGLPPQPPQPMIDATAPFQLAFEAAFPDRPDRLAAADVAPYWGGVSRWRSVFAGYDVVQCYATSPVYALLAGVRRYVAFEHGTLRDFTRGDDPLHRLTALAYRGAAHTFVTNGDCVPIAAELGLPRYSPMVHPVDVGQHASVPVDREAFKARLGADTLLLCPLRHDWAVKGTDIHLRAHALLRGRLPGRTVLAVTDWGREVERSRDLLRELGSASDVVWLRPLCRTRMIEWQKAADVVLDQMALPHFGSTAPQSLAAGTPVIMSYRPESTAWIVDEPAPILAAFSPAEVADQVEAALRPGFRAEHAARAGDWIRTHHGPDRVVAEHLRVYRALLEETP